MATLPSSPDQDFVTTSLNGSINDSVTSIVVNDASLINYPCYAVIDREDANGNATPNAREVVKITGISSNTLTVTRGVNGSTKRSHNDSALFEPNLTTGMWTDMYDTFTTEHSTTGTHGTITLATLTTPVIASFYQDAGKTKLMTTPNTASDTLAAIAATQTLTNKTLTSPVINTGISGTGIAAGSDVDTGTSNTLIVTPKAIRDSAIPMVGSVVDEDDSGGSSTTSSTLANITGADVSITITETSHIVVIATVSAYQATAASHTYGVQLHDGSSVMGVLMLVDLAASSARSCVTVQSIAQNKAAGTYTYTVQHKSVDNTTSCVCENVNFIVYSIPV